MLYATRHGLYWVINRQTRGSGTFGNGKQADVFGPTYHLCASSCHARPEMYGHLLGSKLWQTTIILGNQLSKHPSRKHEEKSTQINIFAMIPLKTNQNQASRFIPTSPLKNAMFQVSGITGTPRELLTPATSRCICRSAAWHLPGLPLRWARRSPAGHRLRWRSKLRGAGAGARRGAGPCRAFNGYGSKTYGISMVFIPK